MDVCVILRQTPFCQKGEQNEKHEELTSNFSCADCESSRKHKVFIRAKARQLQELSSTNGASKSELRKSRSDVSNAIRFSNSQYAKTKSEIHSIAIRLTILGT